MLWYLMVWKLEDRDRKFTLGFETVFESMGVTIIRLLYRAPNANAFAERWVRTVREECLDRLLIFNGRHQGTVLRTYACHYNRWRHHQRVSSKRCLSSVCRAG